MKAEDIFLAAIEKKTPAEREAYLEEACGTDAALRAEVEGLLRHHDTTDSFLEQSLFGQTETVDQPPAPEELGSLIGAYKLLQCLGEGGFGRVFLAEQQKPMQRKVALKILKLGMDSSSVLARFEAERQALALMDHPNIARIFDAGLTEDHRPFFVMELIKGISITRYCDQERLSPKERLELFIPVCHAVQHAHQKGIIHRDLKPSNVLIALYDGKPIPKVIDFGVAKALGQRLTDRTMFTEVGSVIGTLEYMSPEQAELNNLDIDTRADIYSLGVLLYELLAGSPPFTSQQLRSAAFAEMLRIIREVEPPKPSTRLSSSEDLPNLASVRKLEPKKLSALIKGELDWIVMKCLEKIRNRRYETANNLAQDIQHFLDNEPVSARPPSKVYRLRKFVQRNRVAVVGASLFLTLLVTGIVTCFLLLLRAVHAEEHWQNESVRANDSAEKAIASEEITASINSFITEDILLRVDAMRRSAMGTNPFGNPSLPDSLDEAALVLQAGHRAPLVEAGLCYIIGRSYRSLGLYDKANIQLERALSIRRKKLGDNHPSVIEVEMERGRLMIDKSNYSEADQYLTQLGKKCSRVLEAHHVWISLIDNDIAGAKEGQRDFVTAEKLHRRTLTTLLNQPSEQLGQLILDCRARLANNLMQQQRLGEAEREYLEVLKLQREQAGPHSIRNVTMMTNLSIFYRRMFINSQRKEVGYLVKGEALCQQAANLAERVCGKEHPEYLVSQLALGNIYYDAGKFVECEKTLAALNDALTHRSDPTHDLVLSSRLTYAAVLKKLGRVQQAKPILIETFEKVSKKYPQTDQRYQTVLKHLIDCLQLLGETELEKEYSKKLPGRM